MGPVHFFQAQQELRDAERRNGDKRLGEAQVIDVLELKVCQFNLPGQRILDVAAASLYVLARLFEAACMYVHTVDEI